MTASKQKPRYPSSYDKLKQLEDNATARAAKFPADGAKLRVAQQFCTRYRLAASFDGIKISGFVRDRTGEAYGALFHVFVCYTALEMMLEATGKDEKSFISTLTRHKDTAAATRVLNASKSRDFLIRLRDEHHPKKGKAVRTAINQYLDAGGALPAAMYAKAIRNAFAHGRLPSAPGNVGADRIINICGVLCKYLLQLMDDEFDTFMK
jgi:hypothetical protein